VPLAGLSERHHGLGCTITFGVLDYCVSATFEHGDHGVCGAEVYSDRSCHSLTPSPAARSGGNNLWVSLPHSSLLRPRWMSKSNASKLSLYGSTTGGGDVFPTAGECRS